MTIHLSLLLSAIATVESANNPAAIGAHGERSAYQMLEITWREHAKPEEAFILATSDPALAEQIAEAHIISLTRQLERAGVPVTPASLARAWHSGPTAAIRAALHHTGVTPGGYVERVTAIYSEAVAKLPRDLPEHLKP